MNTIEVNSFKEESFGLKEFCIKFERYLLMERDFVTGSLVVALNAPFGFGKSTFLRMWKTDLDKRRKDNASNPEATILNAWEHDYCGDPLLAMINGLLEVLTTDTDGSTTDAKSELREAALDLLNFTLGIANSVVARISGIDPIAAGKHAQEKKAERSAVVPDILTAYESRIHALRKFKSALQKEVNDRKVIFIFVDELDRCRPDYAVTFLETIKHIFDIRGLIFVLSVDYEHLGNSARALFGQNLNFNEYVRKFVHRKIDLPAPSAEGLEKLTMKYVKCFLTNEGKRRTLMPLSNFDFTKTIVDLTRSLDATPRQIQEAFRIIGHVCTNENVARNRELTSGFAAGVTFLSLLKATSPEKYCVLSEGSWSECRAFCDSLRRRIGAKEARWWFWVLVTGSGVHINKSDADIREECGEFMQIHNSDSHRSEVAKIASSFWGLDDGENNFRRIRERIDTCDKL